MLVEDPQTRIKAIKLLGAVFSVGNFATDFGPVFVEFKRRSLDKDSEVRCAARLVFAHFLRLHPCIAAIS